MKKLLSLGDCNTLGLKELEYNSYPERLASQLNYSAINLGFTMSTTREAIYFFDNNILDDIDLITIQYGLVDSWLTFKYSPYVLYFPDNFYRKIFRKIVKKYKKIAKKIGLNRLLGVKNVVPTKEYCENLEYIIKNSSDKNVFLIETIPNKDTSRNSVIKHYNGLLKKISSRYNNCHLIELYDYFESNLDKLYLDSTHCNSKAYDFITHQIIIKCNLIGIKNNE